MNFVKIIILFTICSTFYCCNNEKKVDICFSTEKELIMDSFISEIKFIPLEFNNEIINEATEIYFDSLHIYIYDLISNKIVVFNHKGEFITKVGNRGEGPGEYTFAKSIFVDNDYIYILDYQKIIKYSKFDFSFISEISGDFGQNLIKKNNKWIFFKHLNDDFNINIYDNEFNLISKFIKNKLEIGILPYHPNRFYSFNNNIYIFPPFENNIYLLENDTCYLYKTFSFKNKQIIPIDVYNSKASQNKINDLLNDEKYVYCFSFLENNKYLLANYWSNQTSFLGIYNKKNNSECLYTSENNESLENLEFVFYPITTYDSYFVSFANTDRLKKSGFLLTNSNFKNLLDSIDNEQDILVLWKIN